MPWARRPARAVRPRPLDRRCLREGSTTLAPCSTAPRSNAARQLIRRSKAPRRAAVKLRTDPSCRPAATRTQRPSVCAKRSRTGSSAGSHRRRTMASRPSAASTAVRRSARTGSKAVVGVYESLIGSWGRASAAGPAEDRLGHRRTRQAPASSKALASSVARAHLRLANRRCQVSHEWEAGAARFRPEANTRLSGLAPDRGTYGLRSWCVKADRPGLWRSAREIGWRAVVLSRVEVDATPLLSCRMGPVAPGITLVSSRRRPGQKPPRTRGVPSENDR
jgi:hypothetical protein